MESAMDKVSRLNDLLLKIIIESLDVSDCMQIARQIQVLKLSFGNQIDFELVFQRMIHVLGWEKHEKKYSSWESHFVHLCIKKSIVCLIKHVNKSDLSNYEFEQIVSSAAKNQLLAFTGKVTVESLAKTKRIMRSHANQFKRFVFKNDWESKNSLIVYFPPDGLKTNDILNYIRIRCPDVVSIKNYENYILCTKKIGRRL